MSLTARGIALQGFLLTPVAMAVQGLLAGEPITPGPGQPPAPMRVAASARRQTSMSLAEYLAMVKRLHGLPEAPAQLAKQAQVRHARVRRQRKQHRIAALALQVLE